MFDTSGQRNGRGNITVQSSKYISGAVEFWLQSTSIEGI